MPFGMSSGIPNVIIHAKFHVDRLRGFWAAKPPKMPFHILIKTTLTTVLHYRADCDLRDRTVTFSFVKFQSLHAFHFLIGNRGNPGIILGYN